MSDNLNAELVAIGTELLLGEITDTNSVFMARTLRDIGVNVYYMTTVGDNLQRISDAIDLALNRAEIVITCGGLGPTVDDMTRQGIAKATNRELVFHQFLYDTIAERFRGFGVTMTENNSQQAYLPDGAKLIENPVGTAPSFIVETERGTVISLPGVPREMKYLMNSAVIPYLLEQYSLGTIIARILKTAGIGESSLDDMLGKEILSNHNPTVGLAAHHGSVDIRITAKADSREDALHMLDEMQTQVMERVSSHVYGSDSDTLEDIVVSQLTKHNVKLHVIEAGLVGAISARLRDESHIISSTMEHPDDAYKQYQINSSISLKDCAIDIAKENLLKTDVYAVIVIMSYPEINENADVEQGSVVTVALKDMENPKFRVYGFGARSDLARDWMPRWGLSTLWRLLKEKFDVME